MPRTKYLYDKQAKQNDAIAKNARRLAGEIGRICFMYRMTHKQFAEEVGIAERTINRRIQNPNTFTYGELALIEKRFPEFKLTVGQ